MNTTSWRDTAELIALIAVVVSLMAVVYELRQTQIAMQAQTYQTRALDGISTNFEFAKDPAMTLLMERVYEAGFDVTTLTDEERVTVSRLLTITRIDLDNEHYQYQRGLLDAGFYKGETEPWLREVAPIWRAMGHIEPRPDFRAEVDRILSQAP